MTLDPKVTQAVQDWLNAPPAGRDILAGAELLLSLNRNRALYNAIIRRPDKLASKLEYELKKHLRMRLDGMTAAAVAQMERKLMPAAEKIAAEPPSISSDDELPDGELARGRRADHDQLPAKAQALWDENVQLRLRITILFNELKAMSAMQPCDRYEKLVIMAELDRKYRANFEAYDNYAVGAGEFDEAEGAEAPQPASANALGNARKTLSKYRKLLAEMPADDSRRAAAIDKIKAAAETIIGLGGGLAEDTKAELAAAGIKLQ